jgi:coenzyme F420-reducing hydrogenase beta subunit
VIQLERKEDCCGCSACEQSCPVSCIRMIPDEEGFLYPEIDKNTCICCGLCERVCPVINSDVNSDESYDNAIAFAAWNIDENLRLSSSSGGIFSALAEKILKEGGIVFGVTYADDFKSARHIACDSVGDIGKLRGSKYLQSDKQDIFSLVKEALKQGQTVLFSGTPCEIEGLKHFLQKPYDNLFCVDIICHGTPSPKLWAKYVSFRESLAGARTVNTFPRHKKYGWKRYSTLMVFSNKVEYLETFDKDLFMQMFLQDLCLRPACYECKFKKLKRESDLTLADFWGCDQVVPELDDDKGLSLVIVHSERGRRLLQDVNRNGQVKPVEVDAQQVLAGNPCMLYSSKRPERRDEFMNNLDRLKIPELAKAYVRQLTLVDKVKRIVKCVAKRVLNKQVIDQLMKIRHRLT